MIYRPGISHFLIFDKLINFFDFKIREESEIIQVGNLRKVSNNYLISTYPSLSKEIEGRMDILPMLWTALTHFPDKATCILSMIFLCVIAVTAYFLLYKPLFQILTTTATCLLLLLIFSWILFN